MQPANPVFDSSNANNGMTSTTFFDSVSIDTVESAHNVSEVVFSVDGIDVNAIQILTFTINNVNIAINIPLSENARTLLSQNPQMGYNGTDPIVVQGANIDLQLNPAVTLNGSNAEIRLNFAFLENALSNMFLQPAANIINTASLVVMDMGGTPSLTHNLTLSIDSVQDTGRNTSGHENTRQTSISSTVRIDNTPFEPDLAPQILATGGYHSQNTDLDVVSLFSGAQVSPGDPTRESAQTFTSLSLSVFDIENSAAEYIEIGGSRYALDGSDNDAEVTITFDAVNNGANVTFTPSSSISATALTSLVNAIAFDSESAISQIRTIRITQLVDSGSDINGSQNTFNTAINAFVMPIQQDNLPTLTGTAIDPDQPDDISQDVRVFENVSALTNDVGQGFTSVVFTVENVSSPQNEYISFVVDTGMGNPETLTSNLADGSQFLINMGPGQQIPVANVALSGSTATITFTVPNSGSLPESAFDTLINSITYRGPELIGNDSRVITIESLTDSSSDNDRAIATNLGLSSTIASAGVDLTAVNDVVSTPENSSLTGNVLNNDTGQWD